MWGIYSQFRIYFLSSDDVDLTNNIQWGCALKVRNLSMPTKLKLCGLLDPPDFHGKDWCLLGLRLGLAPERITGLEMDHPSPTMRMLSIADCTIGKESPFPKNPTPLCGQFPILFWIIFTSCMRVSDLSRVDRNPLLAQKYDNTSLKY